ncbi:hypothetical protein ABZS89_41135, partial [Streptomyces sp. NPDC005407]
RIELGLSAKGLKIEKDPGGGMRAVDAAVGGTARLRREHQASPMPDAFLYLLERLDVIERREAMP